MTRLLALIAALSLSCAGLIPPGYPARDECREYDDSYLAARSVAIAFGGTAGVTGTSGVLTATLTNERGADIALAAVSGLSGIVSAVASFLADWYAERVTRCGGEEP